jgi:hypothetical protein
MTSLSQFRRWLDSFVKTQQRKKHPGRLELTLSVALLSSLAIAHCVWPIWRVSFPLEIDTTEAWMAWHADIVRKGLPLYSDQGGSLRTITHHYHSI